MDNVALCIWREARNQGFEGMLGVANVISNRAKKHKQSLEQVVMKKWAFSSMTAAGDPQLNYFPRPGDVQFKVCNNLVEAININNITDNTLGATLYYDDSITFPSSWNPTHCEATVKIGRLNFYKEI